MEDIVHLIRMISNRMKVDADRHFSDYDLTFSQVRILHFIHQNGDAATQKQLETHMAVSHPTIAGIVSRLENTGYVTSRQDENDRRNKIVELTDKALGVIDDLGRDREMRHEMILRGLSPQEVETVAGLLRTILNNLDTEESR